MTEEQIKNLKKGDTFTLKLTVAANCQEGVYADLAGFRFDRMTDKVLRHCILEQPAPTFEVGDTVRIVPDPMTRTIYGQGKRMLECEIGEIGKITVSCIGSGDFRVKTNDGNAYIINVHCLELVKKAVKDRYFVQEGKQTYNVCYHPQIPTVVTTFVKSTHPNAEAAAKAECDRLNAEWSKQQESNL